MSWTWIENTHVRGSRRQSNTLLCELEAWQERSYRLLIQGRSKVRPVSWLQFPGPGVALFLGMAPRSCLHKFGGSQGGTDGGHMKAQADCVGSVTGSVRSGCCIPPVSSTATSGLFLLSPKSWFIYFSCRKWERRTARILLFHGLEETVTILASCQILNVTFC